MQGPCASIEDVKIDFEGLEEDRVKDIHTHQESRQKAIRSAGGGACRKMGSSEEELHPNEDEKEELSELVESIKDSELKHVLNRGAKRAFGSFFTSKNPIIIFEHVWGYLASKGIDCETNQENLSIEFAIK